MAACTVHTLFNVHAVPDMVSMSHATRELASAIFFVGLRFECMQCVCT